jgi:hypothetical protein
MPHGTSMTGLGAWRRCDLYSGRNITASFSYITERGDGKMGRAGGSKTAKSLSEHVQCPKTLFSILISTQSLAFWYTDFTQHCILWTKGTIKPCSGFNVQLRLPTSHCRVYFKWTVATLLQSLQKHRLFCGTGGVAKGSFYGLHIFKYLLASSWSRTTPYQ